MAVEFYPLGSAQERIEAALTRLAKKSPEWGPFLIVAERWICQRCDGLFCGHGRRRYVEFSLAKDRAPPAHQREWKYPTGNTAADASHAVQLLLGMGLKVDTEIILHESEWFWTEVN